MFPDKETTVWVNFRDKPYLGKVLQTSPELDMVCVRIFNYLDHVSRNSDENEFVAHSCPESILSMLSNRQSSVVITCGIADICLLEANKTPHFQKSNGDLAVKSIRNESDNILERDSLDIRKELTHEEEVPDQTINCSKSFVSTEDEADWSESFGINKLLRKTRNGDRKEHSLKDKFWQCRHCQIDLNTESEMYAHVVENHKLETFIDKDNWVIIGGIKGLDYNEVKSEDDTNIKSLNDIHISNSPSRKRQFLESEPGLCNSFSSSKETQYNSFHNSLSELLKLENSLTHNDFQNSFNEEIIWQNLKEVVNENSVDFGCIERASNSTYNYIPYHDFNMINNDQQRYDQNFQIFQKILQQHFKSSFTNSLSKSLNKNVWENRFRSNSISDQYILSNNPGYYQTQAEFTESDHLIRTPSKKSRMVTGVKKCRKMYGIDQRHLWCNQCKWKKACSRFSNEININ